MHSRYTKVVVEILGFSVILFSIGLVIWFVKREAGWTLQDILFWVAITPIALFTIGQFGGMASNSDEATQLSKTLIDRPSIQVSTDEYNASQRHVKASLKWIVAGVLVFLISIFM